MYKENMTLQRDEAIRSGALAGATLMLAAQGMGFATTPMTGFDAAGVAAEFGIPATEVPVSEAGTHKCALCSFQLN